MKINLVSTAPMITVHTTTATCTTNSLLVTCGTSEESTQIWVVFVKPRNRFVVVVFPFTHTHTQVFCNDISIGLRFDIEYQVLVVAW